MTVVTTLLTSSVDPQRGERLEPSADTFADLLASVERHGQSLVVLADELELERQNEMLEVVPVNALGINPYLARWQHYYDWLDRTACSWTEFVWLVDATDVEMLHDPGIDMQPGVLYVGSEPAKVGLPWLRDNHPSVADWIPDNAERTLLNAGILGADRDTLLEFIGQLLVTLDEADATDMGAFNKVAWSSWSGRLIFGERVHTVFRAEDRGNDFAWWRHK